MLVLNVECVAFLRSHCICVQEPVGSDVYMIEQPAKMPSMAGLKRPVCVVFIPIAAIRCTTCHMQVGVLHIVSVYPISAHGKARDFFLSGHSAP